MSPIVIDISQLPGAELIEQGLADLAAGRETPESLLVLVGAPRLRRGGVHVADSPVTDPERLLYEAMAERHGDGAHSKYNALIRRLVSFENALECANR